MTGAPRNGVARPRPSVLTVLQRADARWAKANADDPSDGERLRYVAQFVESVARHPGEGERALGDLQKGERRLTAAVTAHDQLEARVRDLRSENEQLRRQVTAGERAVAQQRAAGEELAARAGAYDELKSAVSELSEAKAQLERDLDVARDARAALERELADLSTVGEENAGLRRELSAAADELARQQHDAVTLADELALSERQLATLQDAERELLERVRTAEEHRHHYAWPDPTGPVLPCECGKIYPPYVQPEVPDEPSAGRADAWADAFAQLRRELRELGLGETQ